MSKVSNLKVLKEVQFSDAEPNKCQVLAEVDITDYKFIDKWFSNKTIYTTKTITVVKDFNSESFTDVATGERVSDVSSMYKSHKLYNEIMEANNV